MTATRVRWALVAVGAVVALVLIFTVGSDRLRLGTVQGLALASIYMLIALGFVIIYKSTTVLSFAQPALLIFGAYFVSYFATVAGVDFWISLALAMALTAGLGFAIERVALRPMVGKPVFSVAILTIGLDIAIRTVVDDLLGVDVRSVGHPWGAETVEVGGVAIRHSEIATVVATLIVVGIVLAFFQYSRTGLAMRATALDQEVALANGVPVSRMFALAWVMAGAMAALAGMFVGTGFAGPNSGSFVSAIKALPAVVIGGLDSVQGAIAGALLVGLAEAYAFNFGLGSTTWPWLGNNFSQVVPYLVMLVVLLIRPYGIFGTRQVERV